MAERTIKYSFWLRFDSRGGLPKTTSGYPSLAADERGMKCVVDLPSSLFIRPTLTANITITELPQEPFHVDIEAAENALTEVLGAAVIFTVVPPAEAA